MLRTRLFAATAVATAMVAATGIPANASITGVVAFECTASLPQFPGAGTGTCSGTAILTAGAGTTTTGEAFVAAGPGSFSATFTYNEPCTNPGPVPLQGFATGTATIGGVPAVIVGNLTPQTATVTTNFSWTRTGLLAVISTTNTRITFSPSGKVAVATMNDNALAVFVPLGVPGSCPPPGPPIQALVVGADIVLT